MPASQLFSGENVLIAMARDSGELVGNVGAADLPRPHPSEGLGKPYQGRPQDDSWSHRGRPLREGGQGVAYGSYLRDNFSVSPPWN